VPTKVATQQKKKMEIIRADAFKSLPWLVHGFSTRQGGDSKKYGGQALNLGFTKEDARAIVESNRNLFLRELGAEKSGKSWPLVTARQIHSDLIHRVDGIPVSPLAGDGLVTDASGVMIGVLTADCLPVILVDSERRAVGVFHAGWRGTFKRIVEKGVGEMRRWYGSQPKHIRAAIGPGIGGCCYQVGEEVRAKFEAQFEYAGKLFRETKESNEIHLKYPLLFLTARAPGHSELPRKIFLDLVEANRRQLLAAGVPAKNIWTSDLCTSCHPELLFSHRAEQGRTGRMMGAAGILK
jgi:hypothetical protein